MRLRIVLWSGCVGGCARSFGLMRRKLEATPGKVQLGRHSAQSVETHGSAGKSNSPSRPVVTMDALTWSWRSGLPSLPQPMLERIAREFNIGSQLEFLRNAVTIRGDRFLA